MSSKPKTTTTKEEMTPALLPKLRFPEFRGVALRSVLLGDVTKEGRIRNGQKHSVSSVMGVTKAEGIVPMEARLIAADIARYKLVQHDWFAYNPMRLNIGSIARWTGGREILVSPDYVVFKCLTEAESGISPGYLDYFRQTKRWEEFVSDGGDGSVRVRIYYKDIARVRMGLPPFLEQQRVADCLISVDELIAAQARKVVALKSHQKGLMQQLLPREGENQPRLRFPEFQNAGEWVPKRLKDISPSVFDGTHQTPNYTLEGVPFYSVENLISGNANKFISRDDYLLATKKNRPEQGDVLLTRIGKIGYSKVATWSHEFSVYVTLAVIKKSDKFNSHFLSHFIQSDFYQSELRAKSLPNAVPPKINLEDLRDTRVLLTNEDEQQRIATCLSSLDALITAESEKHEILKTYKKGLLQQLFPSAEGN